MLCPINSFGVGTFQLLNRVQLNNKQCVDLRRRGSWLTIRYFKWTSSRCKTLLALVTNQHQLSTRILTHKYFQDIDVAEVHRFPLERRGSMIWNMLKFGPQLVKDGLFLICHSRSQALFWLNSWDGHPTILTTHPQLHALYQTFSTSCWDTINFYKIGYVQGLDHSFCWKHPS